MAARVDLEMALSRVLTKARVIERALYEPISTWWLRFETASLGPVHLAVTPQITESSVLFEAETFVPVAAPLELLYDRELVLMGDWTEAEAGDVIAFEISLMETPALA